MSVLGQSYMLPEKGYDSVIGLNVPRPRGDKELTQLIGRFTCLLTTQELAHRAANFDFSISLTRCPKPFLIGVSRLFGSMSGSFSGLEGFFDLVGVVFLVWM